MRNSSEIGDSGREKCHFGQHISWVSTYKVGPHTHTEVISYSGLGYFPKVNLWESM